MDWDDSGQVEPLRCDIRLQVGQGLQCDFPREGLNPVQTGIDQVGLAEIVLIVSVSAFDCWR